jgi:uncharacterized protein (TIGR00251 family)
VSLQIKVKPSSFKNEISFDTEGTLVVKLREKPIDGAANEALIKFLSKEFGLSKSAIVLEKGASSRFKKMQVNIGENELQAILSKYR